MKKIKSLFLLLSVITLTACSKSLELSDVHKVEVGDSIGTVLNTLEKPSKKVIGDDAYKSIDEQIKSFKNLAINLGNEEIMDKANEGILVSKVPNLEEWQYKYKDTEHNTKGVYSIFISDNQVIYIPAINK